MPDLCDGVDEAAADRAVGVDGGGLRYWVAAIRECFEECGVLFATRPAGRPAIDGEAVAASGSADYRAMLIDGRLDLASLCAREGLRLACEEVLYFSHWLTPEAAAAPFRHAVLRCRDAVAGRTRWHTRPRRSTVAGSGRPRRCGFARRASGR